MSEPLQTEPERISSASLARGKLRGKKATPLVHQAAEWILVGLSCVAILAVFLIFAFVAKEALPIFWESDAKAKLEGLANLILPRQWTGYSQPEYVWQPVGFPSKYNVIPLFVGTLKVTAIAMAISAPLGIASAVFVSQYCSPRLREWLKPGVELLASIPSVVLGFFALMTLATFLQNTFGWTYRLNATVAAIGLSIAVVPVIFTISEDALSSVPKDLRAAALALGARQYQVILRLIIPAALPGLAAAVILGFGRAIGETMVVLMASGNAAVMRMLDPTSSARTITATIASELGEVSEGDVHWRVLFLLGASLFMLTFFLNRAGNWVATSLHSKLSAEDKK